MVLIPLAIKSNPFCLLLVLLISIQGDLTQRIKTMDLI